MSLLLFDRDYGKLGIHIKCLKIKAVMINLVATDLTDNNDKHICGFVLDCQKKW